MERLIWGRTNSIKFKSQAHCYNEEVRIDSLHDAVSALLQLMPDRVREGLRSQDHDTQLIAELEIAAILQPMMMTKLVNTAAVEQGATRPMELAPRWRFVAGKHNGQWQPTQRAAAESALLSGQAVLNPANNEIELRDGVLLEQEIFR